MEYEKQLSFLRRLLQGLNISSCIVSDPDMTIPTEIDLHLRADLFALDNYAGFLQNPMSQAQDHTLYRFYDEYDCTYIFLRLPEKERYFFVGPYLLSLPTAGQISKKAVALNLSPEQTRRMQLYYTVLPLIEDENLLLTMTNTFAAHLWGSPEYYTLEYVDYAIPDRYEPIPHSALPGQVRETSPTLSTLEQSYARENQLMQAVSKGNLHLVTAVASTVFNNGAEQRMSDSLRDRKNNLVILKTLLRKAAEYGGVHPMHIHRLASHYAGQIENIRTMKQSLALQEDMIRSFCQMVKQHSLSRYSYYVGQTITLVQYDLTADLKLSTIAEKLNINASYLSALFREETGQTVTAYVNEKRMQTGAHLLQTTRLQIQTVAQHCGISDLNYFSKLFKKQYGITPKQFREEQAHLQVSRQAAT